MFAIIGFTLIIVIIIGCHIQDQRRLDKKIRDDKEYDALKRTRPFRKL